MKKGKIIAAAVVLALVLVLELFLMSHCTRQTPEQTAAPAFTVAPSAPPVTVTDAPSYTSPPVIETTPSPAPPPPQETPVPTEQLTPPPTEQPATGTVTGSGSFSSSTGTAMNINISWQAASQGNGITRVSITGTVTSYSFYVTNLPIDISFGGYSASCVSDKIEVSEDVQTTSQLFTATLDVPTGTAGDMVVNWHLGGSYSGVDLPTVTASGYVTA